jgi:hypothetical protein
MPAKCRYCGQEIHWQKQPDGRFIPFEDEQRTVRHLCRNDARTSDTQEQSLTFTIQEVQALKNFAKLLKPVS